MTEHGADYLPEPLTVLEICAGAGGQALGLEKAGFSPVALVEIEAVACETLLLNRPEWPVYQADITTFSGKPFEGVDLLAGGVPCPPFSIAGKQLGADDERDLFPAALRLVRETRPRAVMLENVRGFAGSRFDSYRRNLQQELSDLGYASEWRVLNAAGFGVPQLRPRWILIALREEHFVNFDWPAPKRTRKTVGGTLRSLMASAGWPGAIPWSRRANSIAPTLVGGSRKHGGPDLGPTRAKQAWAKLGVDGLGIANAPPAPDFPEDSMPRLTTAMVARLQGFPASWRIAGRKTAQYRQIGNAFPPPVARAVSSEIQSALAGGVRRRLMEATVEAAGGA